MKEEKEKRITETREMYYKNEKFRDYVDEYCENNECSLSEAFKRKTVIEKAMNE